MTARRRPTIALIGALDTKAAEYGFCRDRLAGSGVDCLLIDTGVLGAPDLPAEVTRERVAGAGGGELAELRSAADRNQAMIIMAAGAAAVVEKFIKDEAIDGLLMIGGSNAGFLMSRIAPVVPIGVPKLLVSTIVAGDTRPYVGGSDLTMIYPVVDIAGLNSISRMILSRASDALAGMVRGASEDGEDDHRPTIGCTMFGVTTGCVETFRDAMEERGREVHVFHATGVGGRGLESMIKSGVFAAVADITTTELVDDLVGGVCTAGPSRLTAAVAAGIPQVVSVGAVDMANFGPPDTVPERFKDRLLYPHNPSVTLMRTNAAENAEIGRRIAAKLNPATVPTEVHIPLRGFSQISAPGGPFHDPVADQALVDALRADLRPGIALHLHDLEINSAAFAGELAEALDRVLPTTPDLESSTSKGSS